MTVRNGVVVTAPVSLIPELDGATPEQLAAVDWDEGGLRDGLYWDEPDVAFAVRGLLGDLVGALDIRRVAAKGGRPRKASR